MVFDIGGVFLIPHHEPVRAALGAAGIDVAADEAAFHRGHHVGVHAIAEAVRSGDLVPDEATHGMWAAYDRAYFAEVGVAAEALAAASEARMAQRGSGVSGVWSYPLQPNIDAFHRLTVERAHLEVAIVSNNDGTAEQQMLDHGVCQVGPGPLPAVRVLIDSGVVGVAKPDPTIFDPVLDELGMAPERILYVGDTYQSDVLGARAAGLQVVQLDPYDLHHDYDHLRVRDVAALLDLLAA